VTNRKGGKIKGKGKGWKGEERKRRKEKGNAINRNFWLRPCNGLIRSDNCVRHSECEEPNAHEDIQNNTICLLVGTGFRQLRQQCRNCSVSVQLSCSSSTNVIHERRALCTAECQKSALWTNLDVLEESAVAEKQHEKTRKLRSLLDSATSYSLPYPSGPNKTIFILYERSFGLVF